MAIISNSQKLLSDVEAFLSETGMGPSYFGKCAAGNTEIVARLKGGGRVWPETEKAIRKFMRSRRHSDKRVSSKADIQAKVGETVANG